MSPSEKKNMSRVEIEELIRSSLKPFVSLDVQTALSSSQTLFGPNGVLESVRFVSFLMALEQAIQSRLGRTIRIADKRAFSASNSPFRTIETLATWIQQSLIQEGDK